MNPPLLQLGSRQLVVDGHVLEAFDSLTSMGRVLLVGATVSLDGPDRKGRYELVVRDSAGHLCFGERIDAADQPSAEAFVAAITAAGAQAASRPVS